MKYIVYHCTNKQFDKFDKNFIGTSSDDGIWGRGFYFGNKPNDSYGKICYKCEIELNNPFIVNNYKSQEEIGEYLDVCEGNFRLDDDGLIYFSQGQLRQITSHIIDKGHDGVIVKFSPQWTEYVVFEPEQIKILNKEITEEFNSNFDKWFKGSKVVDKDGKPLICYHGTPNGGFTSFKSNSHFTNNKDYADVYHNQGASSISYKKTADNPMTYAVYLSIKNPFDTRIQKCRDIFLNEYQAYYSPDLTERGMIDWLEVEDLTEWLKENYPEYDGIFADEGGVGGYGGKVNHRGISYIPFNANQIKSVDNNGDWSDKDNIYESLNRIIEEYL